MLDSHTPAPDLPANIIPAEWARDLARKLVKQARRYEYDDAVTLIALQLEVVRFDGVGEGLGIGQKMAERVIAEQLHGSSNKC